MYLQYISYILYCVVGTVLKRKIEKSFYLLYTQYSITLYSNICCIQKV